MTVPNTIRSSKEVGILIASYAPRCRWSPFSYVRKSARFLGAPNSQIRKNSIHYQQHTRTQNREVSTHQPKIDHGRSKLYTNADAAVADLISGSVILSAGFGLCGVADTIIEAIARRGSKELHSLTAVSNNAGAPGKGGLSTLTENSQVKHLVLSYLGANKDLERKHLTGEISIELCPQGTLAERIRCGGAGIPAYYTPTGVSTLLQTGQIPTRLGPSGEVLEAGKKRETKVFEGKSFLMKEALKGDVAIIRAWRVDEAGNCQFRYATKAFGRIMGRAARLTNVEADEIVPAGTIHPDCVGLPGIFVHCIIESIAEKKIEVLRTRSEKEGHSGLDTPQTSAQQRRHRIARRAAKELKHGYYVNLGVGMPTLATAYVPKEPKVWVQSENGLLGMGDYPLESEVDPDIVNAGKETTTLLPGASTFDSVDSFGMVRGGHVDVSILGALQVSASGDLANYMIPGKVFKGMGGAMDLISKPDETKIVVTTDHVAKDGSSKIVQNCILPLTGAKCVSTIITDLCVFQVDRRKGELTLTELAPGVTVENVKEKTDARFTIAATIFSME